MRDELSLLCTVSDSTQMLEAGALLDMLLTVKTEGTRPNRLGNTSPTKQPPTKLDKGEVMRRKRWVQNSTGQNPNREVWISYGAEWYKAKITKDATKTCKFYEATFKTEKCGEIRRKFLLGETDTKVLSNVQYNKYILG